MTKAKSAIVIPTEQINKVQSYFEPRMTELSNQLALVADCKKGSLKVYMQIFDMQNYLNNICKKLFGRKKYEKITLIIESMNALHKKASNQTADHYWRDYV